MMDTKYIRENNLIERYVANQLSPALTEEFELYLLDHPDLLDEVELEGKLRWAISGPLREVMDSSVTSSRRFGSLAMAAALVVGLGLGVALFPLLQETSQTPFAEQVQSVRIGATRSTEQGVRVPSSNQRWLVLTVNVTELPDPGQKYSVTLGGESELFKDTLAPNSNGDIVLVIERTQLPKQATLVVAPQGEALNSIERVIEFD